MMVIENFSDEKNRKRVEQIVANALRPFVEMRQVIGSVRPIFEWHDADPDNDCGASFSLDSSIHVVEMTIGQLVSHHMGDRFQHLSMLGENKIFVVEVWTEIAATRYSPPDADIAAEFQFNTAIQAIEKALQLYFEDWLQNILQNQIMSMDYQDWEETNKEQS